MNTEKSQTFQCFDIVRTVLEEQYPFIPGNSKEEKDELIVFKLKELGRLYYQLRTQNIIPHSDLVTRFAYIYKYVTAHANIVYQLINESEALQKLFEKDVLNITCLGGGPGSDFLGILKYLLQQDKEIHLNCNIFDKEQSWNECWSDIGSKIPKNLRFNSNYETIDIEKQSNWENKYKYLKSDLFTMTYFLSEVYSIRNSVEPFFQNLFSNAKQDSLFVFIDNNARSFYEWFDSLIENGDFEIIESNETSFNISEADNTDGMELLGEFYEKFRNVDMARPKKNSNVAYRIVRKV